MQPLVSILIPAHNAEPWIGDTIRSALEQTWSRKEIIVVDDGSRDQTLQVARQFAFKTVSVVTQENQGAAAARNKALQLCQGNYIQWLDADDLLSPDKVAKQMAAAQACQDERRLLSSGWGYFMYRPARAKFIPTALWCDLAPLEWLLRRWEQNLHMQTATWVVSRELTEAAGPWDLRLLNNDDGEYFCRVLKASSGVQFVADTKVFYRQTASNRLSYVGRSNKKIEAHFLGIRLQMSVLQSLDDSERVRAACLKRLQTSLIHFYPEWPHIVEQAQQLAHGVGGTLRVPRLRWKYRWIRPLFGYEFAKRAQFLLPKIRWSIASSWDRALFLWGNRKALSITPFVGKVHGISRMVFAFRGKNGSSLGR
jgi:glycosyltransferase involved in cell wall biosynthesis